MANKITYTPIFEKYFKRYAKKYHSLPSDLGELEIKLLKNPALGTSLGDGFYKIRLAIKSKNKGKSGGVRVISYLVETKATGNEIKLIIIYDKSDIDDISKDELFKMNI